MTKMLDHVALSVTNLERSIAFYCDLFGMQVVRIIECPPERGLGEVTGMPGCSARIAHLQPRRRSEGESGNHLANHSVDHSMDHSVNHPARHPSNEASEAEPPAPEASTPEPPAPEPQALVTMLELFEYEQPVGKKIGPDRKQADIGFTHIGFSTDDVRADYERLKAHGVRFVSKPIEFRPNVWLFYFYGPDGEVCELRQS